MVVIILSASAACGFFFLRLKEIFLGRQIQGSNFSRTKKNGTSGKCTGGN